MPKGTVVEHKLGSVKLRVPFDAGASDYRFYTNEVGSGLVEGMVQRTNIAAPAESPPGFHEFDIGDGVLKLRPDRGWHTRITKVASGVESALAGEPPTLIFESEDGGKTVRAETTAAAFDGTAGKGLFDFGQRERTKMVRVKGFFSASSNYTLSLEDKNGTSTTIDSGTGVTSFYFDDPITLEPGDKLKLTSSAVGNHKAEATRE